MKFNFKNKKNNKNIFIYFTFFILFFYFLFSSSIVFAANLYFYPSSGTYQVGENFQVKVYVSSPDQAMNAASGLINFDTSKLEVVSISKTGSIFSLWVEEPNFSNISGSINFSGVVFNPGFTGDNGRVLNINFKVKSSGIGSLVFKEGQVLANDGQGTNIIKNLGNAQFNLIAPKPIEETETQVKTSLSLPSKPIITSLTHPDENKWYSNNNVLLKWNLTNDITQIKIGLSKNSDDKPDILVDYPFTSKEYKNLEDGIWYFHLQFKNNKGWSEVSHYKLQIDSTPPEPPEIKFIDGKETRNPNPVILFNTTDKTSGIDFYRIKIGDGDYFDIKYEDITLSNPYTLPYQAPGKHTILIQAFDKAGNFVSAYDEFEILPPASWFEILSKKVSITLMYLIPLIALIILLIILILYGIRWIILVRKKTKKEVQLDKKEVQKLFEFLRNETYQKIKNLEAIRNQRKLTVEEEKIMQDLIEDLNRVEKVIKQEFEDILKDI